jgi:hypothetical protein
LPLSAVDDPPYALTYVVAYNAGFTAMDYAPDSTADLDDWGMLTFIDGPIIRLHDVEAHEVAGNGDGSLDPGEIWDLDFTIANAGLAQSSNTVGTLSSSDADITVMTGTVDFGAVAAGSTATGAGMATIAIDALAPSTASMDLDLTVIADGLQFDLTTSVQLGIMPGDTGADAGFVSASTTLQGSTNGLANDYTDPSSCTGYMAQSSDGVYAIDLTLGQVLTADLTYDSGGPDAVIYISASSVSPDLSCLSGADSNVDETESLWFVAPASGTYYLVVDGYYSGESGDFVLDLVF